MKNKILKITGLVLGILIIFVCAAPYLFKGKIANLVKARINKDLRAHVNFSDVDISWFRHFPKIAIGLDNLQVICVGEFQGDTLMLAKQFDMACGLGSLISGDSTRVYSITVDEPHLYAHINKQGQRNWNIMNPPASSEETAVPSARAFKLELQRYAIHQGYIDYQDESRNVHVEIVNLEHEGRGDISSDLCTLKTKTTADAVNVNAVGAIPYRLTAKTNIEMSFRIDNRTHVYSFNTDRLAFNDLKLHTEGFFQWINDSSYAMNIKFNSRSTEFKNMLSMLPAIYQRDFAGIKSGGQVFFNGFVKGKYDDRHFPAYHVNLDIKDGFFKYNDLPMGAEHINLALHLDNPDGMADNMVVNIPRGHVQIDDDSAAFHLVLRNQATKPFIDFALVGKLNLANISRLIKLESGTQLSGLVNADIHANGNPAETKKQKKNQFEAGGSFDLSKFLYVSKDYPGGIALDHLLMTFNPKNVLINELKGAYLSSHINASGAFNNLFNFALEKKPLNASINLKVDELNLRDWMGFPTDAAAAIAGAHQVSPFVVPPDINFTIDAEADKLHYDNLDMQNVSGRLLISDETIQLDQVKADALEGAVIINGTYSTWASRENPDIAFNYDVKGLDVQKTFFAFNAAQKIMPVGKFISGKLDAKMSLNGRLGENMVPIPESLHGEGNIVLVDGSMKDFGPLDKLAESLDIAELKDIPLTQIRADFSFERSKTVVSPFIIHTKDIEMGVGGAHGFDQSLDYDINLRVPRNQLGNKGNLFVKNVVTQAADKGIPIRLTDAVNLNVKMTGTINSPDVKADMNDVVDHAATDLKQEVSDFVNAKLDSARKQLTHHAHPAPKQLFVRTAYKSKNNPKGKHTVHSASKKNVAHKKSKKKQKRTSGYYSTSFNTGKSTAGKSRN